MSDLTVPTTVSNFQERWVITFVNPANRDDKMEFASVEAINAELFRLKAEVERLRAASFVTAVPVEQYERVIKAGDAMVELLKDEGYNTEADEYCMKEVVAWNAAKEGKPSV